MKSIRYWALAISANTVAAVSNVKTVSRSPQIVPHKFIIEVDPLLPASNKHSFARSLDVIYSSLQESTLGYEVTKEFVSMDIFVGAVVTLNNDEDAIIIANTPGVRAVHPVRQYEQPRPVKMHVVTGLDDPELPPDTQSTHILTGVDKLHAEGVTGTGIKIGIIDTGIDYHHPLLGGGIGANHKVIGGHDFVGDAYDGTSKPVPDDDPLDTCNGHGTHVAGIIGANPENEYNISGVACGASLTSYRIFGCSGGTSDDLVIEALVRGVHDGQDIINLSLGGSVGWTESVSAVVADRIAASGKIVTISAGNDGTSGSWYSQGPSNAINTISVASVDNTLIPLKNATVHGTEHAPITYYSAVPLLLTGSIFIFPVYATSNDTTVESDACDPLPDTTPDLLHSVVVIRRGGCPFVQKLNNVAAKGAKVALIYNNAPGFNSIEVGNFSAALIQAADGVSIVQRFAAGVPIWLSFPQTGAATQFPDAHGGLMSNSSSYGPSNDFYFKPAVAAPGGNILSTLPLALGGYAIRSGTSMASPFVAGAAALLLSTKGKTVDTAKSARRLFESTAQKVSSSRTDGDPLQTLTQQGAGLINVYDAIYTTTIISPTELILNDTAHFAGVQTFTVQNTGSQAKFYSLNHAPAGTALTVQPGSIFTALGPVPLSTVAASVELTPSNFTVEPGETQSVLARFIPPAGLDLSTYPVYSGFIEVLSGSENLHVSYLGLFGNLKDKQVIDDTDVFFGFTLPAIVNATQDPQLQPTNYTFVGTDYPSLLWRLAFGTPALRVDLVEATADITCISQVRNFAEVNIVGSLTSFDYIPRHNEDTFSIFGITTAAFANGSSIPNGSYRILMRALRVTGDPQSEEDYETWLSPTFGVQVKNDRLLLDVSFIV